MISRGKEKQQGRRILFNNSLSYAETSTLAMRLFQVVLLYSLFGNTELTPWLKDTAYLYVRHPDRVGYHVSHSIVIIPALYVQNTCFYVRRYVHPSKKTRAPGTRGWHGRWGRGCCIAAPGNTAQE